MKEENNGRLTCFNYSVNNFEIKEGILKSSPSFSELVSYIGLLEGYIQDNNEGIWDKLDLKDIVWKGKLK